MGGIFLPGSEQSTYRPEEKHIEQKRELTLEEMDKVSGGNGGDSWGRNPDLIDCPSCGMPVATSVGITSGECPHCHKPIPIDSYRDINTNEDPKPVKIL